MTDIRAITSLDDISGALRVFDEVWHAPPKQSIPHNLLRAMTAHTNLLLGAFENDRCVGTVLGWWGREKESTFLWSSKLGVIPERRGTGLAEQLKRRQKQIAESQGANQIRWTFDPMRAPNAALNLRKLGAVGIGFWEDLYGPRDDALNAGERTDRMLVVWGAPKEHGEETQRISITERDQVRDQMRAAFDDGYVAIGFERPGTYVFERASR